MMVSFLSRKAPTFFIVGAVAIVARAIVAISLWSLPHAYVMNADSAEYHSASLVLAGLADGTFAPVFALSPLTILFGALCHYCFGPAIWAVIVPQILMGTGAAMLTAAIARRLVAPLAGLIAGLLVALSGPLILFDCVILATSLSVFLSLWAAWTTLEAASKPSVARAAILGVILGLWAICRPNSLIFVPAALFIVVRAASRLPRIKRAIIGSVLVLATVFTIAPITISNYVRGDVFVPITWTGGMTLFIGNNQSSPGRFDPIFGANTAKRANEIFTKKAEQTTGHEMNEAQVSWFWTIQAAREIADDPVCFAIILGRKIAYGLNSFEIPDNLNPPFLEIVMPVLSAPFVTFGMLFSLGIVGLIRLWRVGPPGRHAVHALAAVSLGTMLAFFVVARFRAPMLLALAIGSGATIVWLKEKIQLLRHESGSMAKRRISSVLLAASLGICAASVATHLPILHTDLSLEVRRITKAYVAQGRTKEAVAVLKKVMTYAEQKGDQPLATATTRELVNLTKDRLAR